MKVMLRKAAQGHTNLFEWSPNGQAWYRINYNRIVVKHNGEAPMTALAPYREAMNQMHAYPSFWISVFEGSYDRKTKVLTLKVKEESPEVKA